MAKRWSKNSDLMVVPMKDARPLKDTRTSLVKLLERARSGELDWWVDRDGFIHLNDNGKQVMYYEVDNLELPIDMVSRV